MSLEKIQPKLSVCLIAYNQEKYIRDALDGVLMQQTPFNYELIIHDDASTDSTADILRQYKERYKGKIHLIIENDNQFSKTGFNFIRDMFALAKGEYIALCEGDDYWTDPLKLQKQVEILELNSSYSMSIHNALRINCMTEKQDLFNGVSLPTVMGVKDVLLRGWFAPTASFVFRRRNVVVPAITDMSLDIAILYQNAAKGKVHYSHDVASVYRYSSINSLSEKYKNNRIALYRRKLRFLNYVDGLSRGKYLAFTIIARLRLFAAAAIYLMTSNNS